MSQQTQSFDKDSQQVVKKQIKINRIQYGRLSLRRCFDDNKYHAVSLTMC